jgi:hypothetical protein
MNDKALEYLGKEVASHVVQVEIRNVYGRNMLYPVNQTAYAFAALLGVKTFNKQQVQGMKDLGYVVGQVVSEVTL